MQRPISIFYTQHGIIQIQKVEGEVDYLTTFSNLFPLEYMELIIKKKQKQ